MISNWAGDPFLIAVILIGLFAAFVIGVLAGRLQMKDHWPDSVMSAKVRITGECGEQVGDGENAGLGTVVGMWPEGKELHVVARWIPVRFKPVPLNTALNFPCNYSAPGAIRTYTNQAEPAKTPLIELPRRKPGTCIEIMQTSVGLYAIWESGDAYDTDYRVERDDVMIACNLETRSAAERLMHDHRAATVAKMEAGNG